MKFISIGSSALARRSNMSSSKSTTFAKESLNIPLNDARTSILGLRSSSNGIKSYLTTLPVPSLIGRAPTKARTIAIDSPTRQFVSYDIKVLGKDSRK